jgi:hypothetical protein
MSSVTVLLSLWRFAQRSLKFFFFTSNDPRRRTAREPCSDELDWVEHARIGAHRRLTPDSDLTRGFPSLNFWIGALKQLVHGDRRMVIGTNAFRPNYGGDDQFEAEEGFTGSPGVMHTLWFGQNTSRRAGRRWGWVTADTELGSTRSRQTMVD